MVQDARPDRAEAAARGRSSSSAARASAALGVGDRARRGRRQLRASAARYISIDAGIRANSSRSTTTSSSSGSASCRSMSCSRSSTPSNSLLDIRPPTRPMARTGRLRSTVVREGVDPGPEHRLAAYPGQRRDRQLDQVRRALDVAGGERVPDRGFGLPGLVVPVAGAPVQPGDPVGVLAEQVRPEDVGEQVVVAVPAALVVERHHEQVPALQRLQHLAAPGRLGDGVAERAGEPVQDGRAEQEVADVLGLAVEDLLDEVVHDVPVVAGEPRDEAGRVVAVAQRDRGELQGGDPALGPGLQGLDVVRVQLQPGGVGEVGGRLLVGEPEVGRADLGELPARPQPGQRQRRVGAGADDQVHLRREVLEEERHARLDLRALGEVVVVEDEVHVVGEDAELVEDRRQDALDRLTGLQQGQALGAGARCGALESGQHVGPEGGRTRVRLVQGHPRDAPGPGLTVGSVGQPGGEQRRLPEARRGRDQGQPGPPGPQDLVEAGSRHQTLPRPRVEELGLDQGERHRPIGSPQRSPRVVTTTHHIRS